MRIAIFDSKPYDIKFFENTNKQYNFQIKFFAERLTQDTVILSKDFDIVCAFVNDDINKQVIDALYENGIRLLALRSAGYNNVDFKAAYKKVHVVRVPAYSPYAVAEHTVALMLGLNRKLHRAHNRTREANFSINGLLGFDMYGKTVGVIGTGKIGICAINILKGFGMNVIAYDKFPNVKIAKDKGFEYVGLDKLFKKSNIITLHCPLTKETEYLINKKSISQMKNNVMIINTSRGKLIETEDLIDALKNRKIGSAGLDVYEEENEYFFEDFSDTIIADDVLARLLTFNNVLVTAHQGFFTYEALTNIAETTFENIQQFIEGESLDNEICYNCQKKKCNKKINGRCF